MPRRRQRDRKFLKKALVSVTKRCLGALSFVALEKLRIRGSLTEYNILCLIYPNFTYELIFAPQKLFS